MGGPNRRQTMVSAIAQVARAGTHGAVLSECRVDSGQRTRRPVGLLRKGTASALGNQASE